MPLNAFSIGIYISKDGRGFFEMQNFINSLVGYSKGYRNKMAKNGNYGGI